MAKKVLRKKMIKHECLIGTRLLLLTVHGFAIGCQCVCLMHLQAAFAKPLLYEVPTYLRLSQIGTLNRKTKRKKR